MTEEHQRLKQLIIRQLENNGIRLSTKRGAEAEYFMIVGYLAHQAETEKTVSPYLVMLTGAGRRLTQEKD